MTLTSTSNNITLESTVKQDKTSFNAEELEAFNEVETTGYISKIQRTDNDSLDDISGSYTGTMIFTISIDDGSTDEPEVKQYGLFSKGEVVKSWDDLVADGDITVVLDDTVNGCNASLSGDLIIPDSITYIGNESLASSNLTSVTLPDSIKSLGSYAFMNCKSLVSTNIPDGITRIGTYTFANCKSLTSIDIPNSVTSIGNGAFNGCTSLASIDIPSSVTTIYSDAFLNVPHIEYHGTAEGSPWGALSIN